MPERECSTCTRQVEWGCDTDAVLPMLLDGEIVLRCPRRPFLDDPTWYNEVLRSYKYVQQGMLTEPGTWMDQGAMLAEAFEILDKAVSDARDKQKEGQERRRAATGAQGGRPSAPPAQGATGSMSPRPGRN